MTSASWPLPDKRFTQQVLTGVWAVTVVVCLALVIAAGWLTPERLDAGALSWMGPCPAKLAGNPCAFCGMSHSFGAMAALDFRAAARFNAAGPLLFSMFLLNALAGLLAGGASVARVREARNIWAFWPSSGA